MMREGCAISRCTMEPLIREIGSARVIRGKPARTTISDKAAPCPCDHVNRQFYVPAPNMQWVSHSTYVATGAGSSTSTLRQVQDRLGHRQPRPPGVSDGVPTGRHFTFVPNAIEQALHDRGPVLRGGIFYHSDCGSRYASITYVERFAKAGIEPSVGTVGNTLPTEAERQYYSVADNMDMAA